MGQDPPSETRKDPPSHPRQAQYVEAFGDEDAAVTVLFQVISLPKQLYLYLGLAEDPGSSLQSTSLAMMSSARPTSTPISTVVLPSTSKTQNNDTESLQLAQMLCRKAGMPVLVSYNLPPGAVTDAVKAEVCRHAATVVCQAAAQQTWRPYVPKIE
jgi:hypothetical protein